LLRWFLPQSSLHLASSPIRSISGLAIKWYDIPSSHVVTGLKMVMGAEISFATASTFTKLSMLTFSQRLLANSNLPFWRRITVLAMLLVSIQGSVFCLTIIFQCRPISDYWTISKDPQPNCISQTSHLLAAGIINILTDFAVVILPIRMVLTLRLPRRDLIMVAILFGLGFISCLAGIARTYYLYITTTTHDQVWAAYPVWVTSAIELYLGVICASIPATKPFFSTYLPQVFGSIISTRSSTTGNSRPTPNTSKHAVALEDTTEEDLQDLISALEKSYGSNSPESKFARLSRLSQQDATKVAHVWTPLKEDTRKWNNGIFAVDLINWRDIAIVLMLLLYPCFEGIHERSFMMYNRKRRVSCSFRLALNLYDRREKAWSFYFCSWLYEVAISMPCMGLDFVVPNVFNYGHLQFHVWLGFRNRN